MMLFVSMFGTSRTSPLRLRMLTTWPSASNPRRRGRLVLLAGRHLGVIIRVVGVARGGAGVQAGGGAAGAARQRPGRETGVGQRPADRAVGRAVAERLVEQVGDHVGAGVLHHVDERAALVGRRLVQRLDHLGDLLQVRRRGGDDQGVGPGVRRDRAVGGAVGAAAVVPAAEASEEPAEAAPAAPVLLVGGGRGAPRPRVEEPLRMFWITGWRSDASA